MKKVLALVLALLMVLSCFSVSVFAAEEEEEEWTHTKTFTNVELNTEGGVWSGIAYGTEIEGFNGKSYLVRHYEGGEEGYKVGANGGFIMQYKPNTAEDISDMGFLKFRIYVDRPDLMGSKVVQFELTSSGKCDVEESSWNHAFNDMVEGGLKEGWNEACIPLSSFGGGMNKTNWNFLRIYNLNAEGQWEVPAGEECNVAFDDFYFAKAKDTVITDEDNVIMVSNCDYAMTGWGGGVVATDDLEYEKENDAGKKVKYNSLAFKKDLTGSLGANGGAFAISFNYTAFVDATSVVSTDPDAEPIVNTLDIDGYKYFVFDLYVSNAELFKDVKVQIELTSSGKSDDEELNCIQTLGSLAAGELKDGWNTLYLCTDKVAEGIFTGEVGTLDRTCLNYFRMYNISPIEAGEGATIALDNMYFWDGSQDLKDGEAVEVIEYTDFNPKDGNSYVVKNTAGKHESNTFTFSDKTGEVILKYDLDKAKGCVVTNAAFSANVGSQLDLAVAMSEEGPWTTISTTDYEMSVAYRYYDITEAVNTEISDTIYVKIADATTDDGNGGRLYNNMPIRLELVYEEKEETNPHYDVVSTCDTTTGWTGVELNKTIQNQGKACVTKTITAGEHNGVTSAYYITFNCGATKVATHDGTGAFNKFVFDFYISDASKANDIDINWELTSGGEPDKEEMQMITSIANAFGSKVEGGLKDGWNTVVYNVSELGTACDWSRWNFMRLFNNNNINFEEDVIIGFDNIRFWDGDDGAIDEVHEFTINTTAEEKYLDPANTGKLNAPANSLRYNDQNIKTVYIYNIENINKVKKVTFSADIQGQYLLEVSQDGKTWTTLDKYENEEALTTPSKQSERVSKTYDLTDKVDLWENNKIYIRMGDSYPEGGWGGAFVNTAPVSLKVNYIPTTDAEKDKIEATDTIHSISLNPCNTKYGSGSLNKELAKYGSGCVAFQFTQNNINAYAFDEKDCTGMDTFEFWVYISDAAILNESFSGGNLELTSSGGCDVEEISWNWDEIWGSVEGGVKANEWNHVILPLANQSEYADGSAGFRINNVNFIRHFWLSLAAENKDAIVAFDNFCLTDRQAQAKEAAKPEAKPVIDIMAALNVTDAVTLENYAERQKAYDDAAAAMKALSSAAQDVVKEDEAYKNLAALKKLLDPVKKVTEAIEDINALKDLDVTSTDKNDKSVTNARKAYDKLAQPELVSAEVLAILTGKEAEIEARKNAPSDTPTATPTGSADDKPVVVDDKTGVKVSSDKLPEGAKLEVAVIDVDDVKTKVEEKGAEGMKEVGENAEILEVFDITITADGAKVQPDGSVEVTLPAPKTALPEGKKFQVVYIDADGKVTPLETNRNDDDGTLTFNTTHFSYYAIVMADAPAQSSSNTVVIVIIIIVVVLAAAAVCVWLFVFKKKK